MNDKSIDNALASGKTYGDYVTAHALKVWGVPPELGLWNANDGDCSVRRGCNIKP